MNFEEFKENRRIANEKALWHAGEMQRSPRQLAEVKAHLAGFLAEKYFLTPEEMTTEDILVLGDISTAKLAEIKKSGVDFKDTSVGCTSVASNATKKALLVLTLGKLLGVTFDPDRVAEATDLTALAELVKELLDEKDARENNV